MVRQNVSYFLLVAGAILGTGLVVPVAALAPHEGEQVAIVFPPWVDAASASDRVWSAGGYVVSQTALGVVAASASDRFFYDLRRNGALLIFDAAKARTFCGAKTGKLKNVAEV